jgi:serine/threonine-protein kinase PknG
MAQGDPTAEGRDVVLSCALPACGGTIQDGWCDRCGRAPAEAAGTSRAPHAVAVGAAPDDRNRSGTHLQALDEPMTQRWGGAGRTRTTTRRQAADAADLPPIPSRDPLQAIMPDPVVPEHKRFCGTCGSPVGRSHDDRPGRTEGYCRQCRAWFSFTPKLRAGDVVAEQYEIVGCLAHGGQGWIYLAKDTRSPTAGSCSRGC